MNALSVHAWVRRVILSKCVSKVFYFIKFWSDEFLQPIFINFYNFLYSYFG
jgi:hypothetical protein